MIELTAYSMIVCRYMKLIRSIPYSFLLPTALVLGLAPFAPEPHLLEKLRFLFSGELKRSVDIFDLLMHSAPMILLLIKFSVDGIPKS